MGRDPLELADDSLFIDKIRHTFKAADADLVNRALAFALKKSCNGDSTGHKAADLLIDQDADAITIASALLAPLLWQGLTDIDDIRENFRPEVAATLENLSPPFIPSTDTYHYNRKNIHALLSSIGGVPRKPLLFITFRLLALEFETISCKKSARKMAQETLDLFVPIANQLSLGDLRRRLEDACFYTLDPEGYLALKKEVTPIQADDDRCLRILLAGVQRLLDNNNIQSCLQGRTKSLHGIRRKMTLTGKTLDEIMDRIGLRVILNSVPECYTVLGLLHSHFKPIPGTFDDYIGLPKDNGYQSLHTCVYPVREISHKPIEIQIRTELMHMEAEHGAAAHWRYKNEAEVKKHDYQRLQWIEGLAHQHEKAVSTEAFVELLYRQVFSDHMVIFGNGGRIFRLGDKATVRDYLNITNIHIPDGGLVKVNGRTADLDEPLKDGDSVEVLGTNQTPPAEAEGHWPLTGFVVTHSNYQIPHTGETEASGIRSPPFQIEAVSWLINK